MALWFKKTKKANPPLGVDGQLKKMRASVEEALSDPAHEAYWTGRWEPLVLTATARINSCRRQFYWMRAVAATASVIVPALVGLNLSGHGGVWVRWITFVLSAVAGVMVSLLALFRSNDRWFLYRTLHDDLVAAGWALASDPGRDNGWAPFRNATEKAIDRYNLAYDTTVIRSTQGTKAGGVDVADGGGGTDRAAGDNGGGAGG